MKLSVYIIIWVLVLVLAGGCAKIGTPVGGPKDVTPPKVVDSKPRNKTTNFADKKVEITFDEFLKFKDREKSFVTSPPFKKKPEVILKYKTVVVNFKEDLLPNTTYSLNFGNSITDNNEGNPIRDFEFVFSTGDYIDSLSFEGKVVTAFDHKPDKDGSFVMLYDMVGDSVPLKFLPAYTAKTNEKGFFRINYIKPDTFMVVAVKDMNSNFLYDINEEIAFSDSLLYLDNTFYHAPDTAAARDTARSDSAYYSRFKPQMVLYSFVNEDKKQYLAKKERKQANQLFFSFNAPLDTFKILLPDYPDETSWFLKEESSNKDSVTLWITDTTLIKKDSLRTILVYPMLDTMNVLRPKFDTLMMVYKAPKETRRQKESTVKAVETVSVTTNAKDGFDLNRNIRVETDAPIDSIDVSKIYFTYTEDTLFIPVKYTLRRDTAAFRKFVIDFTPVPSAQYSLVFDSLAISSIYGTFNDSTGVQFRAQKEDFYGAIKANMSNVDASIILQVLDEKENIIKSQLLKEDKIVTLDFLAPGKYLLKAIFDRNNNGKWDPGHFVSRTQPETVEYFKDTINVRANWDVEVSWGLGEKATTTTD